MRGRVRRRVRLVLGGGGRYHAGFGLEMNGDMMNGVLVGVGCSWVIRGRSLGVKPFVLTVNAER